MTLVVPMCKCINVWFVNYSILEPVRMGYGFLREGIGSLLSQITMSNVKTAYRTYRKMTYWQLFVAMLKMNFRMAFLMLTVLFHIVWYVIFLYSLP